MRAVSGSSMSGARMSSTLATIRSDRRPRSRAPRPPPISKTTGRNSDGVPSTEVTPGEPRFHFDVEIEGGHVGGPPRSSPAISRARAARRSPSNSRRQASATSSSISARGRRRGSRVSSSPQGRDPAVLVARSGREKRVALLDRRGGVAGWARSPRAPRQGPGRHSSVESSMRRFPPASSSRVAQKTSRQEIRQPVGSQSCMMRRGTLGRRIPRAVRPRPLRKGNGGGGQDGRLTRKERGAEACQHGPGEARAVEGEDGFGGGTEVVGGHVSRGRCRTG